MDLFLFDSTLQRLIATAIRLGADTLAVEYRDGCHEVVAMKGSFGIGIARLPGVGVRASALREELLALRKRKAIVTIGGVGYAIRSQAYESFGETAFEVRRRRI